MKKPPIADKRPVRVSLHDSEWIDDYAWLRADNWQDCVLDPELLPTDIRSYLEAENAYCAEQMQSTKALQKILLAEMRGRIQADDESLPEFDGPWCYLERYSDDDEHPVYLRRPRGGGTETVTINFNHDTLYLPGPLTRMDRKATP